MKLVDRSIRFEILPIGAKFTLANTIVNKDKVLLKTSFIHDNIEQGDKKSPRHTYNARVIKDGKSVVQNGELFDIDSEVRVLLV